MKNMQWRLALVVGVIALAVYGVFPIQTKINLGLDLQGGMHLVLRVDTSKLDEKAKKDATERALEVIRNRIDQFGISEPVIQRQGADQIVVQLPGVTDRQRAINLIGKTALLEFRVVSDDPDLLAQALEGTIPAGYELKKDGDGDRQILVSSAAVMTGKHLTEAVPQFDSSRFNEPYVSLEFDKEGAALFADITGRNIGRRLAIVLDGTVKSAPVIRERIPQGRAQISGSFSVNEANDLSIILRSGALPAPMVIEEERTIGPLLGQDSIRAGVRACMIGLGLVFVFMIGYYLLAGVVASIALFLNLLLILGFLGLFGGTLTLPGIAGLILTLGMAVDANVLIYERMREEQSLGKSIKAVVDAGYHKAFSAILDSNLTTIAAAALLFRFGTGPVRGFAVTLTFGIAASMFTAIVVTRLIFDLLVQFAGVRKLHMFQLFPQTKIDFLKWRKIYYVLSIVLIVTGGFFFFARGETKYGVDFSGGAMQEYMFKQPVSSDTIRATLKDLGVDDAVVQQFRDTPRKVLIKTREDVSNKLEESFTKAFGAGSFEILRVESVGPIVGQELRKNAALSLILGLLAILGYVWIRFNATYAFAGVIALLHDVLIAIGAMALTNRPFDLTIVAALLTIAGYSINDTVVIYDRMRENLKFIRKGTFAEILNLTLNQVLSRTVLTTALTMLVVIALFLFGGEVINGFSFALMIGFVSGIYSTVYIATALLVAWQGKKFAKQARR